MNYDDFKKAFKDIESEAERQRKELARKYALANNTIKIGDIFTDHIGPIRVEDIHVYLDYYSTRGPSCIYEGLELKKDGTPTKKGARRRAHQINAAKT